ncbi:uncharacterized protein AAEQ78_026109 isoform 2-T3 [Lycaon pictus]
MSRGQLLSPRDPPRPPSCIVPGPKCKGKTWGSVKTVHGGEGARVESAAPASTCNSHDLCVLPGNGRQRHLRAWTENPEGSITRLSLSPDPAAYDLWGPGAGERVERSVTVAPGAQQELGQWQLRRRRGDEGQQPRSRRWAVGEGAATCQAMRGSVTLQAPGQEGSHISAPSGLQHWPEPLHVCGSHHGFSLSELSFSLHMELRTPVLSLQSSQKEAVSYSRIGPYPV